MIEANFYSVGSHITGFRIQGHSGLSEAGTDILCAAVTSAVRLAECAINDVLGLEASVKVDDKTAAITLKLPANLEEAREETCQTLLAAMMVYFVELSGEYPEHITVLDMEV